MRLHSNPRPVLVLSIAVVFVSCSARDQDRPMHAEISLARQIGAVRAGKSDEVQLEHTPLTDDDLQALAELENLRVLLIDDPRSQVTAAGLTHVAGLAKLEHLRLRGEGVDDAALAQIASLKGLRFLNVPRGSFTDAGLGLLA